jgi:hypothetical protein
MLFMGSISGCLLGCFLCILAPNWFQDASRNDAVLLPRGLPERLRGAGSILNAFAWIWAAILIIVHSFVTIIGCHYNDFSCILIPLALPVSLLDSVPPPPDAFQTTYDFVYTFDGISFANFDVH